MKMRKPTVLPSVPNIRFLFYGLSYFCVPAVGGLPSRSPQSPRLGWQSGRSLCQPRFRCGLLFVQTDCPISNRYAPTIARLHARFQPQGVAFYLVYPDRREDADAIRRHGEEYSLPGQALRDVQHALVKRVGASVTPEAVVLGERGNIVYRGRIDDRYMALDQMRPQPTRSDLANALEAALAGRPADPSATEAIGCFIADLQ